MTNYIFNRVRRHAYASKGKSRYRRELLREIRRALNDE